MFLLGLLNLLRERTQYGVSLSGGAGNGLDRSSWLPHRSLGLTVSMQCHPLVLMQIHYAVPNA